MTTFLLSYDVHGTTLTADQMLGFIKENRNILEWYYPFDGAFIFKSNAETLTLQQSFMSILGTGKFIVTPIYDGSTGGVLTAEMWAWIKGAKTVPNYVPLPPALNLLRRIE